MSQTLEKPESFRIPRSTKQSSSSLNDSVWASGIRLDFVVLTIAAMLGIVMFGIITCHYVVWNL